MSQFVVWDRYLERRRTHAGRAHAAPTTQFGSYLLSICVAAAEIWAHGRGKSPLHVAAWTHRAVDPPAGGEEKFAVSSGFSDFKRFQTGFKRFQAVSADDLLAMPTLAPYSLSLQEG